MQRSISKKKIDSGLKIKGRIFILLLSLFLIKISLSAQSTRPPLNTFTDPRDNQSYRIKTFQKDIGLGIIVTQTWMIDNLNYEMPDSWCYDEKEKNCEQYGRLYTWEAAKKACPEGWHLPTEVEWQSLIHQFIEGGMSLSSEKEEAYKILIDKGSSGFEGLLGGYRSTGGSFLDLGAGGGYWSATELDGDGAYGYVFGSEGQRLSRGYGLKGLGQSVRCLQN